MSERKDILDFRDLEQKKERIKGSIQFNTDFEKGYLEHMKYYQSMSSLEKTEDIHYLGEALNSSNRSSKNKNSLGYVEGEHAFRRKMADLEDKTIERVSKTVWKGYSSKNIDSEDRGALISFSERKKKLEDNHEYQIGFEHGYETQAKYPKLALEESEYYISLKDKTSYQKAFIKGNDYYVAKNVDKNYTISETSLNKVPYDRMRLGEKKLDRNARKYVNREYDKLLTERKEKNRSSRIEQYTPIERPSDKQEKDQDKGMDI
ncbi:MULTISPECIES: hypothetical protein [Aquimarina]|uniref:Uncharacterized protein n=1 Tax=Aquimarina algiphila TaxID=2047982 RepID=A0A554VCF3_9FLAO|nr:MULTISPECIES: hypothetical protein [Aquimarina]TSE04366.1 hypothetical protein FOF46_26435 [Aquimarina algiphila]